MNSSMTEQTLQFIADILGGKLVVCVDGFCICELYDQKLKRKYDLIFDKNGQFEYIKPC